MRNLRIPLIYVLLGPAVGALLTLATVILTMIVPDMISDPQNTLGHDRTANFMGTIALMFVFAYVFGSVPAFVAGICHTLLIRQFLVHPLKSCVAVCGAGVMSMAIVSAIWHLRSPFPEIVAALSAAIMCRIPFSKPAAASRIV